MAPLVSLTVGASVTHMNTFIRPAMFALITALMWTRMAAAAELRFAPADFVVLNPAYPSRDVSDLVLHTVALHTAPGERLRLEEMDVELVSGDRILLRRTYTPEDLVSRTADLAATPAALRNAQVLDPVGLEAWFGPGVELATSTDMAPNQVLVLTEAYFTIDATPDRLRVVARVVDAKGPRTVKAEIPVRRWTSSIAYRLPVEGPWLEASLPILQNHHRFHAATEFAVDFFKVDAQGETFRDGTQVAAHWYAYAQPVVAAADGEVVKVVADQVQDRAFLASLPGESQSQRDKRVQQELQRRAVSDIPNSLTGNLIVLRHSAGETVEYSSYGHLRPGSIRVRLGEWVKAGQVLAEVGDTGDSPVVHLHFQINAGSDPFYSMSLPVVFQHEDRRGSTLDPGWIVAPTPSATP